MILHQGPFTIKCAKTICEEPCKKSYYSYLADSKGRKIMNIVGTFTSENKFNEFWKDKKQEFGNDTIQVRSSTEAVEAIRKELEEAGIPIDVVEHPGKGRVVPVWSKRRRPM